MATIPENKRQAFRDSVVKRERFARKIGLPVLTWTIRAFFLYAAALILYFVGLDLQDRGYLPTPGQSFLIDSSSSDH